MNVLLKFSIFFIFSFIAVNLKAQDQRFESNFKIKGLFVQTLILSENGTFTYIFEGATVSDQVSGIWKKNGDSLLVEYFNSDEFNASKFDSLQSNQTKFEHVFQQDEQLKSIRPKCYILIKNGLAVISSEGKPILKQLNNRRRKKQYFLKKS